MRTLGRIISRYMQIITLILVFVLVIIFGGMEITRAQGNAYENAAGAFQQLAQTLERNKMELQEIGLEYNETCIHNAEAIAYMLQNNPAARESTEELKRIAELMEVDEIHIFDESGRIFAGTHPEYFDYTFDSGEQMQFFKPMLEDKSLKLVQEVTPNTAEGKMMQYSALWSKDGHFIVQVGMAPVRLMKATEKNELSYIFSLLRIDLEADYYAIDSGSRKIAGSTDLESVGKDMEEIGLDFAHIRGVRDGFHVRINGVDSFCVYTQIEGNYIVRVIPCRTLYGRLPANMIFLVICLIVIAIFLSYAVIWCMNHYVVEGIRGVNEKLRMIAAGNLEEKINIQSSVELSELGSYINEMICSLLANNRKMSYVLSKTNMYIGVYEYSEHTPRVRFTEHIPRIFSLDEEAVRRLTGDSRKFREFLEQIRNHPVQGENGVFQFSEACERYVKLEEVHENNETFGVVIDVTEDVAKRREIEVERDIDPLTGLYNRRGLNTRLERLFAEPEKLGYYAMIMIDADGLKRINDTYGHDKGDVYLCRIADTINTFEPKNSVAARQGGDEFVLFLYQYEQDELTEAVKMLEFIQKHCLAYLDEELRVKLEFSFGYVMTQGEADYRELLKQADERMYENKRERKKQRG